MKAKYKNIKPLYERREHWSDMPPQTWEDALNAKKYIVYHLPAEYYVGITSEFFNRMKKHRYSGKDTQEAQVVASYDNVEDALIHEAKLHRMGYYGCQYKTEDELNRAIFQ